MAEKKDGQRFPLLEFDRDLRYQTYDEWPADYLASLKALVQTSPWRNAYHIEPETGLLNDPNGLAYYQGKWHLSYQHFPYGPVHGLKSWYHLVSEDLQDWQAQGTLLQPEAITESHGIYSGTAYEVEDKLLLLYTGNQRSPEWERTSNILLAWMDGDRQIVRHDQVLIEQADFVTDHFRDPQLFEYEGEWYILLGAQRKSDLKGTVLLYRTQKSSQEEPKLPQRLLTWELVGELDLGQADLGFMVECPNLIFVDGKAVLIFCPQGLDSEICHYENIYPNMAIVADGFDPAGPRLVNPRPMQNLDAGFDLYASLSQAGPKGQAVMVGWVGLPESTYPTDRYGYQGALSLVRALSVHEGQLYQYPVLDLDTYFAEPQTIHGAYPTETNQYYLKLDLVDSTQACELKLYADETGDSALVLTYNPARGLVCLDRSAANEAINPAFGTSRQVKLDQLESIECWVDSSLVEIYLNQGQIVLTARYFPQSDQNWLHVEAEATYRALKS